MAPTDSEILAGVIGKAKGLQKAYADAKRMESARLGALSKEQYLRSVLIFVEEVSKLGVHGSGEAVSGPR